MMHPFSNGRAELVRGPFAERAARQASAGDISVRRRVGVNRMPHGTG